MFSQPAYNVGPLTALQRNAIQMAFRWRADGDPLLDVYLVTRTTVIKINSYQRFFFIYFYYADVLDNTNHVLFCSVLFASCATIRDYIKCTIFFVFVSIKIKMIMISLLSVVCRYP